MSLVPTILAFAAMGVLGLNMALVYATAPRLAAYLKRQAPPVDVPEFDFYAPLKMNRLVWLILTIRLPKDRPTLGRLMVAARVSYAAGALLIAAVMLTLPWRAPAEIPRSGKPAAHAVLTSEEPAP